MQLLRYQIGEESPRYGWLHQNNIGFVEGNPFGDFRRLEATLPIENARILAPVQPSKIICVGHNYVAHAKEHQAEVPEYPMIFMKPPTSVIGDGDTIILPPQSQQVEHEAELAIVIGKTGRWIPADQAPSIVYGYTIANDVSARDLQRKDGQWTRSKGFDTFCPLGPWIETDFDPADVMISCHVNESMRQMASTRDMVFGINQLIAFISSIMTLLPGDVILTGTPAGVGPLSSGDIVKVTIEGLGTLQNIVAQDSSH
jgi:2-keto-4-pentenoate hydratase/2-oxohepta-3-ene-1,7-dioic acid hydratase in catechol pathway